MFLRELFEQQGYTHLRDFGTLGSRANEVCGIHRFVYTTAIVIGIEPDGSYYGRYCYDNWADAVRALEAWDGKGDPSGPWIKFKGPYERQGPGRTYTERDGWTLKYRHRPYHTWECIRGHSKGEFYAHDEDCVIDDFGNSVAV